jgi:hypothetical protein
MAEREGFEPSVGFDPHDGLASRWFQPLTHLSVSSVELFAFRPRRGPEGSRSCSYLILWLHNGLGGRGVAQSESMNSARFGRKQR